MDVYIPVGVPKRKVEPVLNQEDIEVKEEQHSTFQPTGVNSQATTSVENNNPCACWQRCCSINRISPEHVKREAA